MEKFEKVGKKEKYTKKVGILCWKCGKCVGWINDTLTSKGSQLYLQVFRCSFLWWERLERAKWTEQRGKDANPWNWIVTREERRVDEERWCELNENRLMILDRCRIDKYSG